MGCPDVDVDTGEEPGGLSTVGDVPGLGVVHPHRREERSRVTVNRVEASLMVGPGRERRLARCVLQLVSAASLLMVYR
jgi:hypothetical protein